MDKIRNMLYGFPYVVISLLFCFYTRYVQRKQLALWKIATLYCTALTPQTSSNVIFYIITGTLKTSWWWHRKSEHFSHYVKVWRKKNIPDPAPAEKQLAETSPKAGGSNSLEFNLLHAWAATGTRKSCARFCKLGCENNNKERRCSLNVYSMESNKQRRLSSSCSGSHCWQRPGWTRLWAAVQVSVSLGQISANLIWSQENTPEVQLHVSLS